MATNYTTKTAALRATKADMRQVAVSKKIEIGSGESATQITDSKVSAEDLLVDVEGTRTSVKELVSTSVSAAKDELTEAIGEVSSKVDNMKMGIDIGTKDDSFENDDDTAGFLKSVSKLNFKGSFVNVIKKDDGTVDLWINPDNNHAAASSGTTSAGNTTGSSPLYGSKYVFASSTNAWDLPTTAGSSYSRSHLITEDQTITIKGTKNDTTSNIVSVGNLTSKLRADVLKSDGKTVIATNSTPYLTREMPTTAQTSGSTLTCPAANGISFSVTNLKRYVEEDTSKSGWDAANGFVPDSVSFQASVTVDTSAVLGAGNTYSINVYLDTYNSEGVLQSSTLLHEGAKYFAYTSQQATIGTGLKAEVTTPVYHNVSGVQYYTAGTEITVTTAPVTNATVMAATNATKRASITLTDSYCPASQSDTTTVTGAASDKENTTIASTTKVFKLGMKWDVDTNDYDKDGDKKDYAEIPRGVTSSKTSLTITQNAHSSGSDKASTATLSGNFWPNPTTDTATRAYLESESGSYARVLGYMDGTTLVVAGSAWDSTQPLTGNATAAYNKQAKISNGTLIHGGASGETRYYVRKFVRSSSTAQCSGFNITVPGFTKIDASDAKREIWMFVEGDLTNGRRIDLEKARSAANGTKGVATGIASGKITVENSLIYNNNTPVYIVVVLKTTDANVTGDIIMA